MASGPSLHRAGRVRGTLAAALAAACILCAGPGGARPCHAGEAGKAGMDKAEPSPIVITARSLVADNKKKSVVYRHDVVVRKEGLTLYADEVVINLAGKGGGGQGGKGDSGILQGSGKIDTIEARGGVKIVEQDKTATAREAVYYAEGDKIVLTGEPRVWQGPNVLTGTKITYNLKDDTVSVDDAKSILYQGGSGPGAVGGK